MKVIIISFFGVLITAAVLHSEINLTLGSGAFYMWCALFAFAAVFIFNAGRLLK